MGSKVPLLKKAAVAALQTLWPQSIDPEQNPVLVSYGNPATYVNDQIIAVRGARVVDTRPTLGTARTRDEVVQLTVTFSVFIGGGINAQQAATERAYELLGVWEDYFKTKPNETLGLVGVYDSTVTSHELEEEEVYDPSDGTYLGRSSHITSILTIKARI